METHKTKNKNEEFYDSQQWLAILTLIKGETWLKLQMAKLKSPFLSFRGLITLLYGYVFKDLQ